TARRVATAPGAPRRSGKGLRRSPRAADLAMDLGLTPAQESLRETARRFVVDVLPPLENAFERAGGVLTPAIAADVRRGAIEAGLAGGELPAAVGGAGWTMVEQVLVHEQYGQVTG